MEARRKFDAQFKEGAVRHRPTLPGRHNHPQISQ